MSGEQPGYLAYLLRMWRVEQEDGDVGWRASLERPGDDQLVGFPNLETTFDFLRQRAMEAAKGLSSPADENGQGSKVRGRAAGRARG